MKKLWLTTLTLSCAACGAAEDNAVAQPTTEAASSPSAKQAASPAAPRASKPAQTPGFDWQLRINEEERTRPAILAYEVSNTDDQPLNFSCEEGGSRVFAGINGGPADLNALTLVSGDQTLRLKGKTEQTELPEMPHFTSSEIAGNAPFLQTFASKGWLTATIGNRVVDMAASPEGAKAISAFVAHCTAP